jgi:CRP/FNR family cyclic AMP-dependent transcriptional regulator
MDTFFFSDTYLLKGAAIGDVEAVQNVSEVKTFEAGQPIMTDKDKSEDIMIIAKGRARVETRSGDLIEELRPGNMIGEIAFFDKAGRTANVVSIGETQVLVIPAERLRKLMQDRPRLELAIWRNAALTLCKRLRDANLQVEALLVPR